MKITKSQKRLFIILGLVLGYAIFDVLINLDDYRSVYFSSEKKPVKQKNELIRPNLIVNSQVSSNPIKQDWKRDPFKGRKQYRQVNEIVIPKSVTKLQLQAITYSADNSMVIINDRIMQEGDEIEGYKILKIYHDKVEISKYGQSIFIKPN